MAEELTEPPPDPEQLHLAEAAVDGDPQVALDRAVATLSAAGFSIQERQTTFASLNGTRINSTNQNPLLGAQRIELRSGFGQLSLKADLGGTRFLQRFITWFPPLLLLALALPWLVLVAAGAVSSAALWTVAIAVGVQLPLWLFLGPWIARRIRRRTVQALDQLIRNAAIGS